MADSAAFNVSKRNLTAKLSTHAAIIAIVVSTGEASTMAGLTRGVLDETEARLAQHSYSVCHLLPISLGVSEKTSTSPSPTRQGRTDSQGRRRVSVGPRE